jgi:hypothetical protein
MKTLIRILAATIASLLFIYAEAKTSVQDSLSLLKASYPAVHQNLTREFKNIENLKYTADAGLLHVFFNYGNSKTAAVFSCDGKCRYSITESGDCLPANIKSMIGTTYPGYSIFAGKEIKNGNETIYQAIIENKLEYRAINIVNDEIEEQQKTKKTK